MSDTSGGAPNGPGTPTPSGDDRGTSDGEGSALAQMLEGVLNRSLEVQWRRASEHVAGQRRRNSAAKS